MRYPYKCPVCDGETVVLYASTGHGKCKTCEGTGIVWSPEDNTVSVFSTPNQLPQCVPSVQKVNLPCMCPRELQEGKVYIGDNFCPLHATKIEIT